MDSTRKTIGGGILIVAGVAFGRESFAWVLAKGLDYLSMLLGNTEMTAVEFSWQDWIGIVLAVIGVSFLLSAYIKLKRTACKSSNAKSHELINGDDGLTSKVATTKTIKIENDGENLSLIEECRKMVADYMQSGVENLEIEDFNEYATRQISFMKIEKYLTDDTREHFMSKLIIIGNPGGSTRPPLVNIFLQEIDRIEAEWRASNDH